MLFTTFSFLKKNTFFFIDKIVLRSFQNEKIKTILYNTMNFIFLWKMYIYSFFIKKGFFLKNAILYKDINDFYNVYEYFTLNKIEQMDNNLLLSLLIYYDINDYDYENIRLKLFFSYDNKDYIIYHSYNKNSIPYPPYTEEIMKNYRKDTRR
jgi:hypothetical protein